MDLIIEWQKRQVSELRSYRRPPISLAARYCLPVQAATFTSETATTISFLHPIIVSYKLQIVSGLRSYFVIKNCLPNDPAINVGILSKNTSSEIIKQLIAQDQLISLMMFAAKQPEATIYSLAAQLGADSLKISEIFGLPQNKIASILGVATNTLTSRKAGNGE